TRGIGAEGIFAQSIGGGGGYAGTPASYFAGSAGGSGSAGTTTVSVSGGSVKTSGQNAPAIYAQSAGGSNAAGGNVSVNLTNAGVNASNAAAVVESSTGGRGAGSLNMTLNAGSRVNGGLAGTKGAVVLTSLPTGAINFLGGSSASLTNNGSVTAPSGGYVVVSTAPTTSIVNKGSMLGSIALAGSNNTFTNNGKFAGGAVVNLGNVTAPTDSVARMSHGDRSRVAASSADGMFTNTGTFMTGELGANTTLTGNYVQTASGTLATSANVSNNQDDQLFVTGNATLAGTIYVTSIDTAAAMPGTHTYDLLNVGGALTVSGLTVTGPASEVASYGPASVANGQVDFTETINFAPANLHGAAAAFGNYLNAIQLDGSSPAFAGMVAEAFDASNPTALRDVYDEFTPENYVALQAATLQHAQQFSQQLLTCKSPENDFVARSTGDCVWGSLGGGYSQQNEGDTTLGYNESAVSVRYGFQHAIGANTVLGGGFGFNQDSIDAHTTSMVGPNVMLGAFVKHTTARDWTYSAEVSGGTTAYALTRTIDYATGSTTADVDGPTALAAPTVATPWQTATANTTVTFLNASLRLDKYLQLSHGFGIAPFLAVTGTRLNEGAIAEQGAGALNIDVAARSSGYLAVQPGIELGGTFGGKSGYVRPHLEISATRLLGSGQIGINGLLQGAASGLGYVQFSSNVDRTLWSVAPSIDLHRTDDYDLRLEAGVQFGNHYDSGSLALEFSKKFGPGGGH
ncbi:MAG TPA: autotransporter domain-containing protein, partial [Candidatus Lustribacter sp.]